MLREINASAANNTASHMMFENNQLTINKMPPKTLYLTEMAATKQTDMDAARTGADTRGERVLDNFIDFRA
jgi:hypothetical protein